MGGSIEEGITEENMHRHTAMSRKKAGAASLASP